MRPPTTGPAIVLMPASRCTGWPTTVIARGEVIVEAGELLAERGRGRFLPRAAGEAARPLGRLLPELDPARNFGAELL